MLNNNSVEEEYARSATDNERQELSLGYQQQFCCPLVSQSSTLTTTSSHLLD